MKYKTRVAYVPVENDLSAEAMLPEGCMTELERVFEDLGESITLVSVSQCHVLSSHSEYIDGKDYTQRESGILYTIIYTG